MCQEYAVHLWILVAVAVISVRVGLELRRPVGSDEVARISDGEYFCYTSVMFIMPFFWDIFFVEGVEVSDFLKAFVKVF